MNFFGFSGILIGVTSCALAVVVFLHNRRQLLNQVWALFALSVSMWGVGAYMISRTQIVEEALLWWRLTHIGIILIPVFFVHFVYIFLDIKKRLGVYLTYAVGIFFLIVAATPYFIFQMRYVFGQFYYDSPPGILYTPFVIFFGLGIIYTVDLLVRKYGEVSPFKQNQIRYFLWAIGIGFIGGSTSFLPVFKIDIYPVLNFAVALYPAIMSFAILKSGFFNIKVILTELLVIILSITLFVYIFFAVSQTDSILRSAVFVFILGIGTWLIRSVQKEVEHTEKIEKLASDLEESNKRQENLIHLISHEVKGGLGKANDVFAEIVEGSFDGDGASLKEMARTALADNRKVVGQVEDVLNSANFKTGKMSYAMEPFDFREALLESVDKYKLDAEARGLVFAVNVAENQNYMVNGDRALIIGHIFKNLFENAINFTPSGSITVELTRTKNFVCLSVKDTGVGITPEDMKRLFTEGGHGKDSIKVNVHSTGYGLFIVKQIVGAHGGKIWAESPGAGKGASFFVEVPIMP